MRNIKLIIEYEGTAYEGWQVQNPSRSAEGRRKTAGLPTIQATIEKVLKLEILKEEVKLTGSGRTDAGVHAFGQVANFLTVSRIPLAGLRKALNSLLPRDITIRLAENVKEDFHSRFSASWKLYRYTIFNRAYPSALRRSFVYFCDYSLDVAAMKREAAVLKGTHDFKSFHSADDKERSSVRTIRAISVRRSGSDIVIDIEGNGFLKNMVRTIVGTLVDCGRGKLARGAMKKILAGKNRILAGPTAPPQGLCLMKVKY